MEGDWIEAGELGIVEEGGVHGGSWGYIGRSWCGRLMWVDTYVISLPPRLFRAGVLSRL